ncbi:MAG: PEP-CTERM sorting domain-containing protein [Chthoniobacterales bacterium]
MKKVLLSAITAAAFAVVSNAFALIASDNASNYGGSWANGNNFGTGFGPWSIANNDGGGNFAGTFIGDSTPAAGDINTSGVSFGLYANPGTAFVDADRNFSSALSIGDVFSFKFGVNFDNGNKGFNLYTGGAGATQILNFNIGSGAQVNAGAGLTLNAGAGAGYDYGGASVLNLAFTYTDASTISYSISRSSPQGNQGVLFSGTVTGTFNAPDGFRFYNSGTDNGSAENNLYANSLSVVPEPSTYALLALSAVGLAGYAARRRARK